MIVEITKLRRELHQFPELSGNEYETADRIQTFLEAHRPSKIIKNLGGTGLVAVYEFGKSGPNIGIRCELDALPIHEKNQFTYRSQRPGVSHKCGHDGHMAIVAGLGHWLKRQSFHVGKVILLFQPAEETGRGAYQMLKDERMARLELDYIFALHNIPHEPLHQIITIDHAFSAEVQSFSISLHGKESHASQPEHGINPAVGIGKIIGELVGLNNYDPEERAFAILTPVFIEMGQKAYGVSPANGELHYTIRTWNSQTMVGLKQRIERCVGSVCKQHQLRWKLDWFEYFPSCSNHKVCNAIIAEAADELGLSLKKRPYPFRFGEDFGWFSKRHKVAMFGLGAGPGSAALHHADYDFPDELILTGINMFTAIISKFLS